MVGNVGTKLEDSLADARAALAALDTRDSSVAGLLEPVSTLRYAEGTLVWFLDALVLADPASAQRLSPNIESFTGEAIATRLPLK